MKKTLLLFAIVLTSATLVFGQSSLQIVDEQGNDVAPGTVIKVRDTDTTVEELLSPHFLIRNTKTNPADSVVVRARRTMVVEVDSTANAICLGTCGAPFSDVSPAPGITIHASSLCNQEDAFVAHYYPEGHTGITLIRYTFFDVENEADSVNILVDFYVGPDVGIDEMDNTAKLAAYPNPATTMLTIDYAAEKMPSDAKLVMYNIAGQEVYAQKLETTAATVNVSVVDFPQGVYVYRIEADGYQTASKKVVVQ